MKDKITFSNEWLKLKESETKLFSANYYFRKSASFFEQLLLALDTVSEQGTAIRFIRNDDFNDHELEVLVPIIIDIAIDGNLDNSPVAKDILIKYKNNKIIREKLSAMFSDYLNSFDDFIYRRLAELLLDLNYSELITELMALCKKSENEDLIEIYDDFIGKYK